MNANVSFKGYRVERHACASSNICRMPYAITVCAPAGSQNNEVRFSPIVMNIYILHLFHANEDDSIVKKILSKLKLDNHGRIAE
jgi:hypothetical protein